VYITGFQAAFTAATGAILATVWQHDTLAQGGSEDCLSFIDDESDTTADDFDFKLPHITTVWKMPV
jgi:hypothetical protein